MISFLRVTMRQAAATAAPALFCLAAAAAWAGEERRAAPEARTAGTLSQAVVRAITRIQEVLQPEDEGDEPDPERALELLNDLRDSRYERMNDFEKSTLLSFYTNVYLTQANYPAAIDIFEEILTIEELRLDTRLRTLRSLGQLHGAEENWARSIDYYEAWRDYSEEEDDVVFKGLSYAHYQLEQFDNAVDFWLRYMNFVLAEGGNLPHSDYQYLSGLYFTTENYASARDLLRTMVVLFDEPDDWRNLSSVYASLDNENARVGILDIAYTKGYFDGDQWYMNLGQSLGGIDIPYSGAKIIEDGIEGGIVARDGEAMRALAQLYMVAAMFGEALAPAAAAAELEATGDGYDTLGYVHYVLGNYEEADEAFAEAIALGDLRSESDTQMFHARTLLELDRFEDAESAAQAAARAAVAEDDDSAASTARRYAQVIRDTAQVHRVLAERRAVAIDFYRSYPPLR